MSRIYFCRLYIGGGDVKEFKGPDPKVKTPKKPKKDKKK